MGGSVAENRPALAVSFVYAEVLRHVKADFLFAVEHIQNVYYLVREAFDLVPRLEFALVIVRDPSLLPVSGVRLHAYREPSAYLVRLVRKGPVDPNLPQQRLSQRSVQVLHFV